MSDNTVAIVLGVIAAAVVAVVFITYVVVPYYKKQQRKVKKPEPLENEEKSIEFQVISAKNTNFTVTEPAISSNSSLTADN